MDPNNHPNDNDVPPPAGGSQGSLASLHGGDPAGRSSQHQASDASSIVLRVSPASGSARFGYIYVAANKCNLQDALMVYFGTSGCDVVVFPCPDFDSFMQDHSLTNSNISFVSNLPSYIIPAGNKFSMQRDTPNHPTKFGYPPHLISRVLQQAHLPLFSPGVQAVILHLVVPMIPIVTLILAVARIPMATNHLTHRRLDCTTLPFIMSPPTSWGAPWGALGDHEASPHSPTTAMGGHTAPIAGDMIPFPWGADHQLLPFLHSSKFCLRQPLPRQ